MAITDCLIPLPPNAEMLETLRAEVAGVEPDEEFWEAYYDSIDDDLRHADMGSLGIEVRDVLAVGLTSELSDLLWGVGGEKLSGGGPESYLPPPLVQALVEGLRPVTAAELDRRVPNGQDGGLRRTRVIESALEVLELLRWAAANNLGVLRDFSA